MRKARNTHGEDFGIRVGAVVARDGALLLVRHEKPDRNPYWVLPGGRLEPGETIPQCAEREVEEETGLRATFGGILYVGEFLGEARHTIDVVARMETDGAGEARLGSDPEVEPGSQPTLREVRWIEVERLAEVELLPTSLRERLIQDAKSGWSAAGGIYLGGTSD